MIVGNHILKYFYFRPTGKLLDLEDSFTEEHDEFEEEECEEDIDGDEVRILELNIKYRNNSYDF